MQPFSPSAVKVGLVTDMVATFDFLDWIKHVQDPLVGLDVETDGLDWFDGKLRLVQFGTLTEGWAVPYQENKMLVREALRILTERGKYFVTHNGKFDLHWLEQNTGWMPSDWRFMHDTMDLGSVLNSSAAKGLKDLAEFYVWSGAKLGQEALKADMKRGGWTWGTVPINLPSYWVYGVLDTILTVHLFYVLLEKCTDAGVMEAYATERGAVPALFAMERKGMLLDAEHCRTEREAILRNCDQIETLVTQYGIENIGSNDQVALAFERSGVVLTETTKTGKWKMDKDTFDLIAATQDHPLVNLVQEYRSGIKMSSTYYANFLKHQRSDGRCHPFWWANTARTGRMSATEPAILTVPRPDEDKAEYVKQVRNSFVAPDGHVLISTDFSNVEARIFADFADERGMKQAFFDGLNLHKYTASQIFNKPYDMIDKSHSEYTVAKNTLFCLPESTKALTQNGPKSIDELKVGDMVAGLKGHGIEWTPIRAVHRPGEMEVITFGNKHRKFRATGNHRWIAEQRPWSGDRKWDRTVLTTDDFLKGNGDHRAILAAQWVVEDRSGLTPTQSALLGWLISDGHVRWSACASGRTSQVGGRKIGVQGYIAQTKASGRHWIKRDLADFIRLEDDHGFSIYPQPIRDIFETTNLERDYSNLYDVVLSMGWEQVSEFMRACYMAEGWDNRIAQNLGPKFDAMRLACFMTGSFPSRPLLNKNNYPTQHVNMTFARGLPTMTAARIQEFERKIEPVWCITTDLDSFVAVDGEDYFLTGNCTMFGGGARRIAITAGIPLIEAEVAKKGLYTKFPGMKQFQQEMIQNGTDNLNAHGQAFIRGVDNRILAMVETDDRYYAFTNWMIQSTACTVLKKRLAVVESMGLSQFCVAAIHDEVVAEVPEDFEEEYRQLITEAMTDDQMFSVPIICATGTGAQRWGEAKG